MPKQTSLWVWTILCCSWTGAGAADPAADRVRTDWAYLERFRSENATLGAARRGAPRVVFIGDSITEGWRTQQQSWFDMHGYVGRGISGQTTPQMLVRFRADVVNLGPAVVHIMGGTNDIAQNTGVETAEEIEGYLASMVELALSNHIKVVIAAIPPAAAFPWRPELAPKPLIQAVNHWLRAYASHKHLAFVDYGEILATPQGAMKAEYSADGVHPNEAGYVAMAPAAQAAIRRALRP